MATRKTLTLARDRLIGHLEWLIEAEGAPPHMGIYTWTSCWEDWVPDTPPGSVDACYTADEFAATIQFGQMLDTFWDAFDGDDEAGVRLPEWPLLRMAARQCWEVFMRRGRLAGEPD